MTFLELSSSSRASQEDNFRDDCFTPGDRVDIVTEFHRKAEDNIPMVRLRAPAAVRADRTRSRGSVLMCASMNTRLQSPPRNQQTVPRNHLAHLQYGYISIFLH